MCDKSQEVRILIVDDHDVVRVGLRSLLDGRGSFRVVGEAASASESIEKAAECHPDVVVMDIRLPDGSGIEACREIRSRMPATKVLMLTSYADDEAIFASILAGAAGYVLKQIRSQSLIEAIESIARGESLLDPAVTQRVLDRLRKGLALSQTGKGVLTEQEERILSLVADGETNREIAQALFLSEGTIKNYVSNILSKLNLSRRAQLAAYVVRERNKPDNYTT
ncbi:MAG: response regulator transcription factor [Dehalococcoidia bacterium]|nr:response regulator transcription factor [Dehalococcoidia bacterium]